MVESNLSAQTAQRPVLIRLLTGAVLEGSIMSFQRVTLAAFTALFAAGTTSVAFAGCCEWGIPAPVVYAPVAPVPVVPVPVAVTTWGPGWGLSWGPGGCGCGPSVAYVAPPVEVTPIAPAPIYVVDQGPDFSGPGILVPYHTWSPAAAFVPATAYPYVPGPGYGHGAPGPRVAYRHPHHYRPMAHWHSYPHRPLGARG